MDGDCIFNSYALGTDVICPHCSQVTEVALELGEPHALRCPLPECSRIYVVLCRARLETSTFTVAKWCDTEEAQRRHREYEESLL